MPDSLWLLLIVVYVMAWAALKEREERRTWRMENEFAKRYEVQTSRGVVVAREDELRAAFRAALKAPRSLYVHDTQAPAGKPTLYDAQGVPTGWVPRPLKA